MKEAAVRPGIARHGCVPRVADCIVGRQRGNHGNLLRTERLHDLHRDICACDLCIIDHEAEVRPLRIRARRLRPEELVIHVVEVFFRVRTGHVRGVRSVEHGIGLVRTAIEITLIDRIEVRRLVAVELRRRVRTEKLTWLRRTRLVEPTANVVERAILKHDNDDVLDLGKYGHRGPPGRRPKYTAVRRPGLQETLVGR